MGREAVEGYGGGPSRVQTITKTRIGIYEVLIWSSPMSSDRALACFMGPDSELIEICENAWAPNTEYMECIERMRDALEALPRVVAYAVLDANGNGVTVELR